MGEYVQNKRLSDVIKEIPFPHHSTDDVIAEEYIEVGTPVKLDGTVPADPSGADGIAYSTVRSGQKLAVIVRGIVIVDANGITFASDVSDAQKTAFITTLEDSGMKVINKPESESESE